MKKHFVEFYSPGTFVAETTSKEIESWDIDTAINMSKEIKERYGATPYGFRFSTLERLESDFEPKEVARSGMYYLGGIIKTVQDLEAENNPSNRILIQNMKSNRWKRVVENNNSWTWVQPLEDDDIILEIS